jgi:hypothetical protein
VIWDTEIDEESCIFREEKQTGGIMFKATVEIATEIAHDLNVSRELVWEIIKGKRFHSIEEIEITVCKALS